jgi:hypothetical protein
MSSRLRSWGGLGKRLSFFVALEISLKHGQTMAMTEAQRATLFRAGEHNGRKRGTPNKLTVSIRDAIEHAFTELGGTSYLVHVGRSDPRTFCALLSKLLPTKLANADGSPLLAALTELTDAQLEARTARALADAQRAGLMAGSDAASTVQVLDVAAEVVSPAQEALNVSNQ